MSRDKITVLAKISQSAGIHEPTTCSVEVMHIGNAMSGCLRSRAGEHHLLLRAMWKEFREEDLGQIIKAHGHQLVDSGQDFSRGNDVGL